jgi:predicted NodU family carbamoyl transferase
LRILGISAFYHDSAAALIVGGDIVAAAQEARFSRVKPEDALRCFMGTQIDLMVCGNAVPEESTQDASCIESYQNEYELD